MKRGRVATPAFTLRESAFCEDLTAHMRVFVLSSGFGIAVLPIYGQEA
jgi:hypothetical protein